MAEQDIDAELLALAGDDSESDDNSSVHEQTKTGAQSPPQKTGTLSPQPQQPVRKKGVAQRTSNKSSRSTAPKSRPNLNSDNEEASSDPRSPDSLGSGAMSESESEPESETLPRGIARRDDGARMYPIDGKFVSQREKDEIMALPEIQREQRLADRALEVERSEQDQKLRLMKLEREKAAAKMAEKKRKAESTDLDDSPRKTSRAKVKTNDNLEAYKKQREQRNQQRRRDEDRRDTSRRSPSFSKDQSDEDGEGEGEVQWDDGDARGLHGKIREEPLPTLGTFQAVRTGRTNFATVCFYPDFESTLSGCFCRASVGFNKDLNTNVYRMMQIKGFTIGKPYKLENPNSKVFMTDQYVILLQGKQERTFPFNQCSDGKFLEVEFEEFKRTAQDEGQRIPTNSFLEAKRNAIHSLVNRSWTEDEINEKLRRTDSVYFAYANMERQRLEKERKIAEANGDIGTVSRLDHELTTFDSSKAGASLNGSNKLVSSKAPTQQDRLAALNRANRKANAEDIRKAQLAEKRAQQRAQAAVARGEAVANPFARVKTTAKVHYDAQGSDTLHARKLNDELFGDSGRSRSVTPMPGNDTPRASTPLGQKMEKKKVATKKHMDDEILASMDLGIDVEI